MKIRPDEPIIRASQEGLAKMKINPNVTEIPPPIELSPEYKRLHARMFQYVCNYMADPPNYRSRDPETSKVAGEAVTRSGRRPKDQRVLFDLVSYSPDQTAIEYAQLLIDIHLWHWHRSYQVANKRISDLHAKGKVRVSGERICRITGRKARTWRCEDRNERQAV